MRSRKRPSAFVRILSVLLCLVVWVGSLTAGTFYGWKNQSKLLGEVMEQYVKKTDPREVFDNQDAVTILILGIDENRYYQERGSGKAGQVLKGGRSDVMMVCRMDFKANTVTGLSIPRDLALEVDGYSRRKINAYYEIGGLDLSKAAAERALGIPIDKVIEFKYEDIRTVVDAVGGVEVEVKKPMVYHDVRGGLSIDLQPGVQVINGEQAVGFVRFRKYDRKFAQKNDLKADSDTDRQERQRQFMLSLKGKVESNPRLLPALANAIMGTLGQHVNEREFAAMILFGRSVGQDNVKMESMPIIDLGNVPRLGYIVEPDVPKLDEALVRLGFKMGMN